jgi:hypothetical protein
MIYFPFSPFKIHVAELIPVPEVEQQNFFSFFSFLLFSCDYLGFEACVVVMQVLRTSNIIFQTIYHLHHLE